jgi:hypothetical protein
MDKALPGFVDTRSDQISTLLADEALALAQLRLRDSRISNDCQMLDSGCCQAIQQNFELRYFDPGFRS